MKLKVLIFLVVFACAFWGGVYAINGWRAVAAVAGASVLAMEAFLWSDR